MHNAIAATLVRLVMGDPKDDPRYRVASDRMAGAIAAQYDEVRACMARGENVGVYREAIR